MKATHATIPAYHRALAREDKAICDMLKAELKEAVRDYRNIVKRKGRLERIGPAGAS